MRKKLIESVTDEQFDEYTFESSIPVVVFFGSKNCKICKELFPIIQDIAVNFANKIKIYWVDVDKYKPLFQRFRLRGIPNLLIFNNGEVIDKISGLHPKEVLSEVITKVLRAESIVASVEEEGNPHMECLGCN